MKSTFSQISLHEQLADVLRKEVQSRQAGEKLESEVALAKRFGVSALTAHQAMVLLAHEGLIVRRRGSGSFVAERPSPVSREGRHVAVLTNKDISHSQLSYSHRRVAWALLHFFEAQGVEAKLYTGRLAPWETESEPTYPGFLKAVEADRIRAVALVASDIHPSWGEPLRKRGVPIIGGIELLARSMEGNYRRMVRQALDHLHRHGRRNIALLESFDLPALREQGDMVRQAFEQHMKHLDLPVREQWIRYDLNPAAIGAGWAQFREIWSASRDKPDALVVTDDILFRDAATAICQLGIDVPGQLMIVTHANKGSGMLYPFPVARIEYDPDQIAEIRGRITLKRLAGESTEALENEPLSFRWVVGDSASVPSSIPFRVARDNLSPVDVIEK